MDFLITTTLLLSKTALAVHRVVLIFAKQFIYRLLSSASFKQKNSHAAITERFKSNLVTYAEERLHESA